MIFSNDWPIICYISAIGSPRLSQRTALVTGASRGLGKAIAIALAAEGAAVAVVARTEAVWDDRLPGTIHETVDTIRSAGGRAFAVAADLAVEDDLERLAASVRDELGPFDILVNNAALTVSGQPPKPGVDRPAPAPRAVRFDGAPSILDVPLKAYRRHFAVNVFAPYRLMQLTLPDMIDAGRGAIINISSRAAFAPGDGPYDEPGRPALFAYGSSKSALHNLTQAVAIEVAGHGIAVNALIPSTPIQTPGSTTLLEGQDVEQWAPPEEFAEAVVLLALASPEVTTGKILWHHDVVGAPAR